MTMSSGSRRRMRGPLKRTVLDHLALAAMVACALLIAALLLSARTGETRVGRATLTLAGIGKVADRTPDHALGARAHAAVSAHAERWGPGVAPETGHAGRLAYRAPNAVPPDEGRSVRPLPVDRARLLDLTALAFLGLAFGMGWVGRRGLPDGRLTARAVARLTGLAAAEVVALGDQGPRSRGTCQAEALAFLIEHLLGRSGASSMIAVIAVENEAPDGVATRAARLAANVSRARTFGADARPASPRGAGRAIVVDARIGSPGARVGPRSPAGRTLADILAGPRPLDDGQRQVHACPAPLAYMPAGHSALPMACLLGTGRWRALRAGLERLHGTVVLVAPPIGAPGFEIALAGCEAILVVCAAGTTSDYLADRMACLRAHAPGARIAVALVDAHSKASATASR